MEKISTEVMKSLPIGSRTTFKCRDGRHCESVRNLAYRCAKVFPEIGKLYSCYTDFLARTVTVEVRAAEKPKKVKKKVG